MLKDGFRECECAARDKVPDAFVSNGQYFLCGIPRLAMSTAIGVGEGSYCRLPVTP
jgi:hypothetical protein